MSDDLEGVDMQLMARFGRRPGTTVRGRRLAETRPAHPVDNRRLRTTGRVAQMNLKVRPDFRDRVFAAAQNEGLLMIELVERAVEAYLERR